MKMADDIFSINQCVTSRGLIREEHPLLMTDYVPRHIISHHLLRHTAEVAEGIVDPEIKTLV